MCSPCFPNLTSGLPAHGYCLDTHSWTNTIPDSARNCTWAIAPSSEQQIHTRCCEMVVLHELEFRSVEQNLIKTNLWQLLSANLAIKRWIIHAYEYSFFYTSSGALWFPSHCAEIIHTSMMACDVGMFSKRERGFKVFFKPFSKSSCRFTNILIITLHHVTLTSIYLSTFLCDGVLTFGSPQGILDWIASFEVYLYPMSVANVIKAQPYSVRHCHVDVDCSLVLRFVVAMVIFGVVFNF